MQVEQLADDLRFLRTAVETQQTRGISRVTPVIWAAYVLIGYTLLDVAPHRANLFFAVGFVISAVAVWFLNRRVAVQTGIHSKIGATSYQLRAYSVVALILLTGFGLDLAIPALRGIGGAQVIVAMFGIWYFMAGLYGPPAMRHLIWGGPIVVLGGICVAFVPHFGWTLLGLLIAAIITLPLFRRTAPLTPLIHV